MAVRRVLSFCLLAQTVFASSDPATTSTLSATNGTYLAFSRSKTSSTVNSTSTDSNLIETTDASSTPVGNYIAQGLGLSSSQSTGVTTTSSSIKPSTSSSHANAPLRNDSLPPSLGSMDSQSTRVAPTSSSTNPSALNTTSVRTRPSLDILSASRNASTQSVTFASSAQVSPHGTGTIHIPANRTSPYPTGPTASEASSRPILHPLHLAVSSAINRTNTSASITAAACRSTPLTPVAEGLVTVQGAVFTATQMNNGEVHVGNITVYTSGVTRQTPCSSAASAFITNSANPTGNVTFNPQCWNQWNTYYGGNWSTSRSTSIIDYQLLTWAQNKTDIITTHAAFTTTLSTVVTYTTTLVANGFTVATDTITTTALQTISEGAQTTPETYTDTYNITLTQVLSSTVITSSWKPNATAPTCGLPSSVNQCQSSWNAWASNQLAPSPVYPMTGYITIGSYTPPWLATYSSSYSSWSSQILSASPRCTQAAISNSDCMLLGDAYASAKNWHLQGMVQTDGYYQSNGYIGELWTSVDGSMSPLSTVKYVWPTSSTLGLGCSIGCGRCAVTGNSVALLYWPPPATSAPPVTTPVTTVTNGVTLTSPTLYISYSELYASDACKGVGGTYYNTIVPIGANPTDMSSQWGSPVAMLNGQMQMPTHVSTYTAPFHLSDLYKQPVPMSIYSSQAWCASWAFAQGSMYGYMGNPFNLTGWSCPSTRPYEPILVPPSSAYANIDPAWSSCHGALQGVYDPPTALQPATAAATVTLPAAAGPSASPVQSPSPAIASPTPNGITVPAVPAASPNNSPAPAAATPPSAQPDSAPAAGSPANNDPQPAASPDAQPQPDSATASPDALSVLQSAESPAPQASPQPNQAPAAIPAALQDPAVSPANAAAPASPQPIAAVGSQTIVADPATSGQVIVGSQTLKPGDTATIGDTPVSVGTGNIVVGGNTINLSPVSAASTPAPVQSVGGQAIQADPAQSGNVVVGGATLTPGQTTVINNTPISVGTGGAIVAGSSTIRVQPAGAQIPPAAVVTFPDGQIVTAQSGQPVVVAGQTISAGGPAAVLNGQSVSVGAHGVQIGSATVPFAQATAGPAAVVVLPNGQTVTAQSGQPVIVGGQALSAGGSAAVIDGQTVSVASNGIVVSSATVPFAQAPQAQNAVATLANGQVVTAQPGSPIVVAGQTLSAGGPAATINGQIVGVASNGLVVGTSTVPFSSTQQTQAAVFTLPDGQIITAQSGSPLVVNGQTLTPGGNAVTINGDTISAASNGIVVDGSTIAYSTAQQTFAPALAPFTISGIAYTATQLPGHPGTFVLDGTTFSAGGYPITVSGHTLSAVSTGGVIVDGTSIVPIAADIVTWTANGRTHTAIEMPGASTAVIDGSVTLTVGKSGKTIDGHSISLASGGLVVDGTTQPWQVASTSRSSATSATPTPAAKAGSTAAPGATATGKKKSAGNKLKMGCLSVSAILMSALWMWI